MHPNYWMLLVAQTRALSSSPQVDGESDDDRVEMVRAGTRASSARAARSPARSAGRNHAVGSSKSVTRGYERKRRTGLLLGRAGFTAGATRVVDKV